MMQQNAPAQSANNQVPEMGTEELAMLLTQLQQAEGQGQAAPVAEPRKPTINEALGNI